MKTVILFDVGILVDTRFQLLMTVQKFKLFSFVLLRYLNGFLYRHLTVSEVS